jgi:hypothetical protein
MKIENMSDGQIVYSVERRKMGNTNISSVSVYRVQISMVSPESGRVLALWNGNPERWYRRSEAEKWRVKPPLLVTGVVGNQRVATREEAKEINAAKLAKATTTEGQ